MSNKKQSSVEWYIEQTFNLGVQHERTNMSNEEYTSAYNKILQQAKEMHRQEILDTYWNGVQPPPNDSEKYERYYNETYGGGE